MSQLKFDLRQAMLDFEARTGIRLTYENLSQRTTISVDTLKSMASREDYNATLKLVATLGDALKCDPRVYLTWQTDSESEHGYEQV